MRVAGKEEARITIWDLRMTIAKARFTAPRTKDAEDKKAQSTQREAVVKDKEEREI